jgi:hypothetical protein
VRIGPNTLSINSATALKSIYGFKANVIKSDFYDAFPATKGSVNTHSARVKEVHARKRRVLSHAFGDKALGELEKYVLANITLGLSLLTAKANAAEKQIGGIGEKGEGEGWQDGWQGEWNMADWCNWLVFDIMGDLVFGKAFGMLESEQNRFAVELVGMAAKRHLIVSFLSLVPPLHPFPFLRSR